MIKFLLASTVTLYITLFGGFVATQYDIPLYLGGEFNSSVDQQSINSMIELIKDGSHPIITVNTPGGSADALKNLLLFLKYNKVGFDTYTTKYTASAGALIWTLGDKRIVERDALITFHSVHAGSYGLTATTVCNADKYIKSEKGKSDLRLLINNGMGFFLNQPTTTMQDIKDMEVVGIILGESGVAGVEQSLDAICVQMKSFNELQIEVVSKELDLDKEFVRKVLFKNFEYDSTFTGQELFDMGIATEVR